MSSIRISQSIISLGLFFVSNFVLAKDISEKLTLEIKPGVHNEAIGERFSIETENKIQLEGTRLYLKLRVRNRTENKLWRPLRVRLQKILNGPKDFEFVESDNGVARKGARWDYSQFLAVSGGLDSGEVTHYRDLYLEVRPKPEPVKKKSEKNKKDQKKQIENIRHPIGSGPFSFVFEVTGVKDPVFVPTALPEGHLQSGTGEKKRWSGKILLTYTEKTLSPERLAKINLAFDLAGQDYVEKLGIYIVHVRDHITLKQAQALVDRLERHAWVSGAEISLNDGK